MPLSQEQVSLLQSELSKPEYAGKSNDECSELLNTSSVVIGPTIRMHVEPGEIQRKVYEIGKMYPLIQLTKDQNFGDLAKTALGFFESPKLPPVDVDASAFRQMLGGLKSANVVTDQEIALILSLADRKEPDAIGLSPFQSISGLGNVPVAMPDGSVSIGTCHPWMISQARGN